MQRRYRDAAVEKALSKELAELEAAEAAAAGDGHYSHTPTETPPATTTSYKPPDTRTSMLSQKEKDTRLANELGKNMWRSSNPGYVSGSMRVQSQAKMDFQYDPEEVEPVNRANFRRRDTFTNYVEAAAKYNNIMKKSGGGGGL